MRGDETGRRAYLIVARREFVERARDRGFVISTAITLLLIVGFIVAGAFFGKGTRFDLGVVGSGSSKTGAEVASAAKALNVTVTVHSLPDRAAATAAARDGSIDAALIDGAEILVRSEPPAELVAIVQAVSSRDRTRAALESAGLDPSQIEAVLNARPLPVSALEPFDARRRENSTVAFVGVLALYGQLFAYGYWVAAGVVEEKASRIVEVLLATLRPSQLLRGKILGIGVLGLCQLLAIGAIGLGAAELVGSLSFPSGAVGTIGIVLAWFVLGYFFYSVLFAVAGAIVPRQEDLQSTMTPLSILIIVSLFIGIDAIQNPTSTLATVASLLPPSAPLTMPSRIVLGHAGIGQVLLSVAISIGATVAMVPLATRLYANAVLRRGRVKIREALRADR